MSNKVSISVIVPFYNAKNYLDRCINNILNQKFEEDYEIIFIDDGSKDESSKILEKYKLKFIKLYSLKKNFGPAFARNIGLKHANGKYIFFFDVDDQISPKTFKNLYDHVNSKNYDLIFSDKKIIKKGINLRNNKFIFPKSRDINSKEITELILKRIHDPMHTLGILGITGRLIKRSIIIKNKLKFENKLRFLEDEVFSWDFLTYCKKVKYVRKQLYSYNVYPDVQSGISQGIEKGFVINNFKTVKKHVKKCLIKRNIFNEKASKLSDQAFIYLIISTLVSFSRSILLKKVEKIKGINILKKLIKKIISDHIIQKSINNYKISKLENKMIPIGIKLKSPYIIRIASIERAKELLRLRGI